jgi:hypothetical protein
MKLLVRCAPTLVLMLGSACVVDDGDHVGDSQHEGMSINGMSINGMSINGMSINGMSINGSQLTGVRADGQPLSGSQLVGASLTARLSTGSIVPVRVDSAVKLAASNSDVWAYGVSYNAGSGWAPLCGTSAGAPVLAVPLAGTWDLGVGATGGSWSASSDSFTFACRGAALAKCVELGYKPWKSAAGVSLRNHHQSCTRMLRADYCGNGQPGTINGWSVNLYDNLGLQKDTENGDEWVFEAQWSPSGAVCVDEYRLLELVVSGDVPTCALDKLNASCESSGFGGGALLRSEYNSAGVVGLVEEIVDQNAGTALADKVEDALASLESAFAALRGPGEERSKAAGYFETAMGDLEAAVKDHLLDGGYGHGLLNRIAGVARHQAISAAADNACTALTPSKLTEAATYLALGDSLRASRRYKDAAAAYKMSVVLAQDARGKRCPKTPIAPPPSPPPPPAP